MYTLEFILIFYLEIQFIFMRKLFLLFCIAAFAGGCKKDKTDEKNSMSADINGAHWEATTIAIDSFPQTARLLQFTGTGNNGFAIAIRLFSLPSTAPGNYNFRQSREQPASLINFNVSLVQSKVVLQWSTGFETGLQSFDIERSNDGINFSTIGSVNATNTTSTAAYSFTDQSNTVIGRYYYRLKMVDANGQFNYSAIRLFNGEDDFVAYLSSTQKYRGYNGTLKIETHDISHKLITGSFFFDYTTSGGSAGMVRNGRFRIQY